jgi:hypothetical protein
MSSRYSGWAGPVVDMGKFEWERVIKKCTFNQSATKLIALLLATYASEDGSSVRPGRERLIATSGLGARHVSTQLGKLEDLGLVDKVHNGSSYGRRGGLASVYQLTAPEELHTMCLEDPNELTQITIEKVWEVLREQVHSSEQVHPSAPVQTTETQEHVHSGAEQVHSATEHVHSGAEQVHPSATHQALTPIKNHQPKNINQVVPATFGDAHASETELVGNSSIEDERSRQLDAMEQRMADYEKQQGRKAS